MDKEKDKKTLAWIGGGLVAGLIAMSLASAKKPPEEGAYVVGVSNINVVKI